MQVLDDFIFFFFKARKPRIAKLRKDFHNEEKGEKNKSKSEFILFLILTPFIMSYF